MKICPTCDKVYQDEDINFCLADGTTLLKKRGPKAPKHSLLNDVIAIVGSAAAQGTAYLIGKIGAGILLAAVFFASTLLVTNFTLAGFLSHFEVAGENLKIRIDEWCEKRRLARSPEIDAAKKRAEKRKERRLSGPDNEPESEIIPPTITIGEPA